MQQTLLSVKNLGVTIEGEPILSSVNFTVKAGEIVVLTGPNGAGKSTLLRALLGLRSHTGTCSWKTKDIGYLPPHEKLSVEGLPITIEEFFHCKKQKLTKSKINTILKKVGLEKSVNKKQMNQLSTGQFQRMLLAWTFISNPSVVFLDDPVTAIDIKGQQQLFDLMKDLWKENNTTIILITHNLDVVWENATRVICLNKSIICQGTPKDTLTPENLFKLYGWGMKKYEHKHAL